LSVAAFYGRHGKHNLLKKISGYNAAAKYNPWLTIIDLDQDATSVADAEAMWIPAPSALMCFAVAVHEVEAWLMADPIRLAEFLGVSKSRIPGAPESLEDPKQVMIALARASSKRDIRQGLVPRAGSGASVGPTYASDLRVFGMTYWRPRVAAENAESLSLCIGRLEQLADTLRHG
jgi:hypothetical protein